MTKDQILIMVKGWAAEWKAPHETYEKRMDLCNKCDKLITVVGLDKCAQCGCVLLIKANSLKSKCPENKW